MWNVELPTASRLFQNARLVIGGMPIAGSIDFTLSATPLFYAVIRNSHPGVIETLLSAGADIEARTKFGLTPLMFAVLQSTQCVIDALLESGADVQAKSNSGQTPLMKAVSRSKDKTINLRRSKRRL